MDLDNIEALLRSFRQAVLAIQWPWWQGFVRRVFDGGLECYRCARIQETLELKAGRQEHDLGPFSVPAWPCQLRDRRLPQMPAVYSSR